LENLIILDKVCKKFTIDKPRGIFNIIKAKKNSIRKTIDALDEISFSVARGEILGIIGLNGSGKTTLMRIIAGVYLPDKGSVTIHGKIAPLMQLGAGFNQELDAVDNILLNGMLLGMSKTSLENKLKDIFEYAELEKFSGMKLKHFSSGMRARLSFAIAMQVDSDIFLIDEILSVGDKDFQKKSYDSILSLKKEKKTIIHCTHNLKKLSEFSDRVILLDKGKIIMDGNPEEVIQKYIESKSSLK